jgi:hypothetical protein
MDRLEGVQAKITRAKHHVSELDAAIKAFHASNPYKLAAKRDAEKRPVYFLGQVDPVPIEVAAICGEIIQSLRSALDHLAYQLVLVGTGKPGPFFHVYFPIFDSPEKYEAGKLGQIKGMRKDAIDAIDAIKPYGGGNDTLWKIHRLNIIDKHRLLVAVGSTFESFDIGGDLVRRMNALLVKSGEEPLERGIELALRPANRLFPLKAGDVLYNGIPDDIVDKDKKFTFEIALNETGIVDGEPALKLMKDMVNLIDSLIPAFEPLLI